MSNINVNSVIEFLNVTAYSGKEDHQTSTTPNIVLSINFFFQSMKQCYSFSLNIKRKVSKLSLVRLG